MQYTSSSRISIRTFVIHLKIILYWLVQYNWGQGKKLCTWDATSIVSMLYKVSVAHTCVHYWTQTSLFLTKKKKKVHPLFLLTLGTLALSSNRQFCFLKEISLFIEMAYHSCFSTSRVSQFDVINSFLVSFVAVLTTAVAASYWQSSICSFRSKCTPRAKSLHLGWEQIIIKYTHFCLLH